MKHFIKTIPFVVFARINKLSLFILFISLSLSVFAQESASIEYKQTVFPRKMLPEDQKQYAMMIPETIEVLVTLRYNKNMGSVEEKVLESDSPVDLDTGNGEKSFYDLDAKKKLTLYPKGTFLPRNFAVKSDLSPMDEEIKHSGKTKEIMGYQCKEITFEMDMDGLQLDKVLVTAYYTEEIPYGHSPMGYMGLSGVLMHLECEYFSYTASEVKKETHEISLVVPEGYKEISEAQYEDIMDEALEGM